MVSTPPKTDEKPATPRQLRLLTPSEKESLLRKAREGIAYARKAFASQKTKED